MGGTEERVRQHLDRQGRREAEVPGRQGKRGMEEITEESISQGD